jgi:hypothetical protein
VEFLSAKALTIAVGIAVSLTIASAVLFTLNQITLIYKDVYGTDISIKKEFAKYSMYQGTVMTGLEMYNAAKKYKNSQEVIVKSGGTTINTTAWINSYVGTNRDYTSRLYDVTSSMDNEGIVTIQFIGRL